MSLLNGFHASGSHLAALLGIVDTGLGRRFVLHLVHQHAQCLQVLYQSLALGGALVQCDSISRHI